MTKPKDLVQGTLDLLILRIVALEPMHGWAIAHRIRQMSSNVLQVGQSALPCTAQAGAAGLDQGRVEDIRDQPPRQVLLAHASWSQGLHRRSRQLGAAISAVVRTV